MAFFGRNMQVFRTIHRVFHSFTHNKGAGVENFLGRKIRQIGLTNTRICGIINKEQNAELKETRRAGACSRRKQTATVCNGGRRNASPTMNLKIYL